MIIDWISALGGAAVSSILVGLITLLPLRTRRKVISHLNSEKQQLATALESVNHKKSLVEQRVQQLDARVSELQSKEVKLGELQVLNSRIKAEYQAKDNEAEQYLRFWSEAKAELEEVNKQLIKVTSNVAQLTASSEEREKSNQEKLKLLQDSKEGLKKEFELLASEVLDRKSRSFKELSEDSLKQLLNPLHTDVKGFRDKVESLHNEETKQRAFLTQELKSLQNLNQVITNKAEALTNALQGQKKVQGNWGELMLENVLDSAGLRLGEDYDREKSFNTEDGRLRPDAVIYLPQKKHLVIDAKTSLNAYTEYVNAEDDDTRSAALKAHSLAVSDRINELADKSYYQLPGLNSPEVVVMFIPIESAYVEALKYDSGLYQRAIEKNVLVATPTTLLTSLNIVRQLWRFEDQSKHSAELAQRASKFYDKLRLFLESMNKVGRQIDSARDSYDKAMAQLSTGRGNVIKQASEFQKLGVSVQRELDPELVESAELELPSFEGDSGETR